MAPRIKSILSVVAPLVLLFNLVSTTQAQQDKSSRKAKWEKTLQAAKKGRSRHRLWGRGDNSSRDFESVQKNGSPISKSLPCRAIRK